MKLVTFDLSQMHMYGTAFYDYLKLRRLHGPADRKILSQF